MAKITKAQRIAAFEKFLDEIGDCQKNHHLKQVGGCVYCIDCNKRLYQGVLPHNYVAPPTTKEKET